MDSKLADPGDEYRPAWCRTGDVRFPVAARVAGQWWVLRANNFPDHPMWTLFVAGRRQRDIDDPPPAWGRPVAATAALTPEEVRDALAPVRTLVAYGSEVGRACDYDCCD